LLYEAVGGHLCGGHPLNINSASLYFLAQLVLMDIYMTQLYF
jgi:hypothetical protein